MMPCAITQSEKDYYARIEHKEKLIKLITYTNDMFRRITNNLNQFDIDELTNLLCLKCKHIEEDKVYADCIIYDGRNPKARELADWWEVHKDFDKLNVSERR